MGRLSPEEANEFQDHCLGCGSCAVLVSEAAEYVEAMRAAARKLRFGEMQ